MSEENKTSDVMQRIQNLYSPLSVKIEVPEWTNEDEEPFTIYSDPWTIHDERGLTHLINQDNPEAFVMILIKKACNETGDKLFTIKDKPELLRKAKSHVIKNIATKIMASIEDQEKN